MNTTNDFDIKVNTAEEGNQPGPRPRSGTTTLIIESITWSLLASPTITSPTTSDTVSNRTENKDCY